MSKKYLINNILRAVEKIPGVNFQQVLRVGEQNFAIIPKNGTRSIRDFFLKTNRLSIGDEWYHIEYFTKTNLTKFLDNNQLIVVTRDPLERLHSCWKQKISCQRDDTFLFYFWMYFPLIRQGMSFNKFLAAISYIPPFLREKHFRPLFVTIPDHKNITFIHISDLSNFLGIKEASNATNKIAIDEADKLYFDQYLKSEY